MGERQKDRATNTDSDREITQNVRFERHHEAIVDRARLHDRHAAHHLAKINVTGLLRVERGEELIDLHWVGLAHLVEHLRREVCAHTQFINVIQPTPRRDMAKKS